MPRVAGDKPYYTFVLRNENTGRYHHNVSIKLPSVTTVIGATLAKPALVRWAYGSTRDAISGLVSVLVSNIQEADRADAIPELLDMLTDADWLEETLKDNQLRPDDIKDIAGERGNVAHAWLEELCKVYLDDQHGPEIADQAALAVPSDSWHTGVSRWWRQAQPTVLESETVLYSLRHGFAGSVDLVWIDAEGNLVITDLKSRGPERGVYESDHVQAGAYKIAYEEMSGTKVDRTSVLVVREDGSFEEESTTLPPTTFLHLLDVFKNLKGDK
jgi:hypothetical protein